MFFVIALPLLPLAPSSLFLPIFSSVSQSSDFNTYFVALGLVLQSTQQLYRASSMYPEPAANLRRDTPPPTTALNLDPDAPPPNYHAIAAQRFTR